MLTEMDNSEFITKLRTDSCKELRQLIERDKERGLIKAGIDSDLILDMTFARTMKEYFRIGSDELKYVRRVKDIIKIIKEGVTV